MPEFARFVVPLLIPDKMNYRSRYRDRSRRTSRNYMKPLKLGKGVIRMSWGLADLVSFAMHNRHGRIPNESILPLFNEIHSDQG